MDAGFIPASDYALDGPPPVAAEIVGRAPRAHSDEPMPQAQPAPIAADVASVTVFPEPRPRLKTTHGETVARVARTALSQISYSTVESRPALMFAISRPDAPTRARVTDRVERYVSEFREPSWDHPELYFFVAANKEALAWGPRAAREVRVQSRIPIAERQVGFTLQAARVQTALAYLERDVSNAYRTDRQGFIALSVAFRR